MSGDLRWSFAQTLQPGSGCPLTEWPCEFEASARCERCGYSVPLLVYSSLDGLLAEVIEHNARAHPTSRPAIDIADVLLRPSAYDQADARCEVAR